MRLAREQLLKAVFGKYTAQYQARAAGVDDRPVIPDWDEKQISAEETFDTDIHEPARLLSALNVLADRTATRLRARQLQSACITVKIRRNDFTTFTRQHHFQPATQETQVISQIAAQLLLAWLKEHPRTALRLLGVGAGELSEAQQLELFAAPETQRNRALDTTMDKIRERYGTQSLRRADHLKTPLRK